MMLDKQIRSLIEYNVKHIKMNNGFFFFPAYVLSGR